MANREGQQLGNYRLQLLLGQGGFAEVYLSEHIHLGTLAAIKVLSAKLQSEEIERFRVEAQRIASLRHPSIVRVLDFDVESGVPFLVMDYATNGSLRQRHPKGTRLAPADILPYVRQVASALQYAHDRKLIHRDVKPENMLVSESDDVLLSDFGIATAAQSSRYQSTKDIVGTVAYMAPEQIQAHPRPASDQYSLGIVIYEWLAGERPFTGSMAEVLAKQLSVPPPPLRDKVSNISPALEQVVLTALEKDPHQRFPSIQAFAIAFEDACQHSPSGQRRTPSTPLIDLDLPLTPPPPVEDTFPTPPQSTFFNRKLPPLQAKPSASPPDTEPAFAPPFPPRISRVSRAQPPAQALPLALSRRQVLTVGGSIIGLAAFGSCLWLALSQTNQAANPSPYPYTFHGHSDSVVAVAWSHDGKRVASASADKTVQVWDASNGSHVFVYLGHFDGVNRLAWSPDGTRIASPSADKTVQVWDARDGGNRFIYRGHSDVVYAASWSPNGQRIASSGADKTVQIWDALDGGNRFTYHGHSDAVRAIAWSPNGQQIASASDDATVQIWNATDGGHIFTYQGHSDAVYTVAWSPDGTRLASGSNDGTAQVWYALNGGRPLTYKGHFDLFISHAVHQVAWSPNGKRIASAGDDNTVQVWGASDGTQLSIYRGHSDNVYTVAWSPDGSLLASGSKDKTAQVWQAP